MSESLTRVSNARELAAQRAERAARAERWISRGIWAGDFVGTGLTLLKNSSLLAFVVLGAVGFVAGGAAEVVNIRVESNTDRAKYLRNPEIADNDPRARLFRNKFYERVFRLTHRRSHAA